DDQGAGPRPGDHRPGHRASRVLQHRLPALGRARLVRVPRRQRPGRQRARGRGAGGGLPRADAGVHRGHGDRRDRRRDPGLRRRRGDPDVGVGGRLVGLGALVRAAARWRPAVRGGGGRYRRAAVLREPLHLHARRHRGLPGTRAARGRRAGDRLRRARPQGGPAARRGRRARAPVDRRGAPAGRAAQLPAHRRLARPVHRHRVEGDPGRQPRRLPLPRRRAGVRAARAALRSGQRPRQRHRLRLPGGVGAGPGRGRADSAAAGRGHRRRLRDARHRRQRRPRPARPDQDRRQDALRGRRPRRRAGGPERPPRRARPHPFRSLV
ncbi:MAG: Allophanate hydrolase 2 subunit 2, partial [uncultured Actinomycetospora sp.]